MYLFTNKENNQFYIGSNFYTRIKSHQINSLKLKRGGNSKFYRFINNSGNWANFMPLDFIVSIKFILNHIFNFFILNPNITLNSVDKLYFNQF